MKTKFKVIMKSGKEYILLSDDATANTIMDEIFGTRNGVLTLSSYETDESDTNGCGRIIFPSTEISSIELLLR